MKKMASFVPRGTISCIDARSKLSRKEQHKRGVAYFKDLKSRSRCFNCGKKGEHWTSDFREPPKRNKDKHAARLIGISASLADALASTTISDDDL